MTVAVGRAPGGTPGLGGRRRGWPQSQVLGQRQGQGLGLGLGWPLMEVLYKGRIGYFVVRDTCFSRTIFKSAT